MVVDWTLPSHNQALWVLLAEEDVAWYVELRAQLGSRLLHWKLLLLHLQQEQRQVCMGSSSEKFTVQPRTTIRVSAANITATALLHTACISATFSNCKHSHQATHIQAHCHARKDPSEISQSRVSHPTCCCSSPPGTILPGASLSSCARHLAHPSWWSGGPERCPQSRNPTGTTAVCVGGGGVGGGWVHHIHSGEWRHPEDDFRG